MTTKDPISLDSKSQSPRHTTICRLLRAEIDAALPDATSRIWHAMPVWFVGDNAVVGYKATPGHVNLLFWNGQSLDEPALEAAGKFKAVQIKYRDVTEIDRGSLRRWLGLAGTLVWDLKAVRKAAVTQDA